MTPGGRLLVFGLLAGLLGLGGVWLLWPRSAITRENAAKIHVGMTLAEAEAILGGPERDESTGPCHLDWNATEDDLKNLQEQLMLSRIRVATDPTFSPMGMLWQSNSVSVWAKVSQEGQERRLTAISSVPMLRREERLLDMLRRWLRL